MNKRIKYKFRKGKIIEVEEYHDGNYGGPGKRRQKRKKPTKEEMQKVNASNKAKRCRHRLLEYFSEGDIFATWTYEVQNRPQDMETAKADFKKAIDAVRKEYKKQGKKLFWIRNIECGTKGAWHIHLVINEIGNTASIIQKAWTKGGTWSIQIKHSKYYGEDFEKLASYMTKDHRTVEVKKDGELGKPRIREASYSLSRNMPLPEGQAKKFRRWTEEPKPKKGYHIIKIHEGINPVTGYKYRRYTMIRLDRRQGNG